MNETHPVSQIFKNKFAGSYFTIDASNEISQIQKEIAKITKKVEK